MKLFILIIMFLYIVCIPFEAIAFNGDVTHPHITDVALKESNIHTYLQDSMGFTKHEDVTQQIIDTLFDRVFVSDLIKEGAELEDKPMCRASNHFHNPLKFWWESRLTDTWWLTNAWCSLGDYPAGEISSNITWGTGYVSKWILGTETLLDANQWDWESARGYFYTYLTGKDYKSNALIAPEQASRNLYMKNCFRAVGQVMHLLQDSSVPAHVRNDFSEGHTQIKWSSSIWPGNLFEHYIEEMDNNKNITWFHTIVRSNFPDPFLTQFWDTDQLDGDYTGGDISSLGLAEYTNLNFLSAFTMFTDDFPFPKAEHCVITFETGPEGIPSLERQFLSSTNGHPGEQVNRLAVVGALMHYREKYFPNISSEKLPVHINDDCYEEYAEKLIPRAIGYSADLLDYFFRGRILVNRPSFIRESDSSIIGLDLSVKNGTPPLSDGQTVEPFESGDIEMVYSYAIPDEDNPGSYESVFQTLNQSIYTISDAGDPINNDYVNFTVTLPSSVPADAIDFSFTLVFKGKLGNENGAIVAKVFNFNNSRIAYFAQPDGHPNPTSIFSVSPDRSDPFEIIEADAALLYFEPNWSKDGTMMAFIKQFCPDDPLSLSCGYDYNSSIVIIDLLSDQSYPGNILYELEIEDAKFFNPAFSPDGTKVAAVLAHGGTIRNLIVFDLEPAQSNTTIDTSDIDSPSSTQISISGIDWSPKGDRIIYSIDGDLYMINPDGTAKTPFLSDGYSNESPEYSPDGKWISYRTLRDGSWRIWRIDTAGQNKVEVVNCLPGDCISPSVSPDGGYIAFSDSTSIFSIRSDGDGATLKTVMQFDSPNKSGQTAWSPLISQPLIETAQAVPNTIAPSESTTLQWQSAGAMEVTISDIAEKQPASGSLVVFPDATTTYTIKAIGPTGVDETKITVTVEQTP